MLEKMVNLLTLMALLILDRNSEEISLPFQVLNQEGKQQSLSEVKVTAEGFLEPPME